MQMPLPLGEGHDHRAYPGGSHCRAGDQEPDRISHGSEERRGQQQRQPDERQDNGEPQGKDSKSPAVARMTSGRLIASA